MGHRFIRDRDTGQPVLWVEEKPLRFAGAITDAAFPGWPLRGWCPTV